MHRQFVYQILSGDLQMYRKWPHQMSFESLSA